MKTPNGARRKKLKGASPGENLKRGAWTGNVVKKKKKKENIAELPMKRQPLVLLCVWQVVIYTRATTEATTMLFS